MGEELPGFEKMGSSGKTTWCEQQPVSAGCDFRTEGRGPMLTTIKGHLLLGCHSQTSSQASGVA